MHELRLTAEEKLILEGRHRETRHAQESDRIKAVLLRSENWSIAAIAQALRVHETTITRHLKDYLTEEKLSSAKGGSCSFLSEGKAEKLIAHLTENLYQYTHQIVDYIENRWNIRYSISGLTQLLHRLGFTYKKAKGRPYKADLSQQAAFIKAYEKLECSANKGGKIIFIDAVHPSQATKLSYGWIKKGETAEIPTTASRTRMNLIGGIELGHINQALVVEYATVNAETVLDFFNKLRERYPLKIKLNVILDQAGYHRSETVKKAVKKLNICLHYLPPYSPNLNPIERLWKIMNEYVRNNQFFKSTKAFKANILGFFKKTLPEIGHTLNDRINDNFQTLNHAY